MAALQESRSLLEQRVIKGKRKGHTDTGNGQKDADNGDRQTAR